MSLTKKERAILEVLKAGNCISPASSTLALVSGTNDRTIKWTNIAVFGTLRLRNYIAITDEKHPERYTITEEGIKALEPKRRRKGATE